MSDVQAGHPGCDSCSKVSQLRSRSAVPVPPMGSQSTHPRCQGNQNGSLCSLVSSVHRAIDRNHPAGVFGQVIVLDGNRLGNKVNRVPGLLQWTFTAGSPDLFVIFDIEQHRRPLDRTGRADLFQESEDGILTSRNKCPRLLGLRFGRILGRRLLAHLS